MRTSQIGNTDLKVTELSFGCTSIANLYRAASDVEARDVLNTAWEAGTRYFDTAPHCGRGLSEQRLGRFLPGKPRSDYVTSTKVGRVLPPGHPMTEADGH